MSERTEGGMGESGPSTHTFVFGRKDLDVLCESLWHSLSRADVPDEDIDRMRVLRERLNNARR